MLINDVLPEAHIVLEIAHGQFSNFIIIIIKYIYLFPKYSSTLFLLLLWLLLSLSWIEMYFKFMDVVFHDISIFLKTSKDDHSLTTIHLCIDLAQSREFSRVNRAEKRWNSYIYLRWPVEENQVGNHCRYTQSIQLPRRSIYYNKYGDKNPTTASASYINTVGNVEKAVQTTNAG